MIGFADNHTRHGARLTANLFDELVVDNFAGGGGASMGIEAAIGRAVDIAVNHDLHSVEMHKLNHPHTRHLCEDVWDVDPVEATAGRPVGLAWFSPDCRHHSRAKGGKPVEKRIRGLAWVAIKWAKTVKPRIIFLENVREWLDWGPLTAENLPCKARKGQTYRRWRKQLENLGYVVDTRILNAADYGAPTHRRRLFLIARCDGQPIQWPEPTHGPGRRPYRTAAQCIDWAIPCPSIFLTKTEARPLGVIRPLAEKTMRRIAMGLKRYVLDNPKPFIVTCNHGGPEFRGQAADEPFRTLTAARDAHGVVTPYVAGVGGRTGQGNVPVSAGDAPLGTVTAKNDRAVVAPCIIRTDNHQSHATNAFDARTPIGTICSANGHAVAAPLLVEVQNSSNEAGHRSVDRPAHTVTANPKGGGMALAAPHLVKFRGESKGTDLQQPLPTITAGAGSVRPAGAAHAMGVAAPFLVQNYGEGPHQETRGQAVGRPILTVTPANNSGNLVAAFLEKHELSAGHLVHMNHGDKQWSAADEPMRTITTGGGRGAAHAAIASSFLSKFYGKSTGAGAMEPMPTVTGTHNHLAEVRAFLIKYFGNGGGQECGEPLHTVTSRDRFGVVRIDGADYQIIDIGLRMLTPRELLNAQFGKYAKGYILTGTKSQQVARIGNSVCPELAEVIVRANYPQKAEVAA